VGQNSLDRVCRVDGPPGLAGKAVIREYAERPGGQVATAALAGARLGLRTAYAGAVGDDDAAGKVLDPLRRAGIDVSGVKRVVGARTQLAVVVVDRGSGERSVLWYREPGLQLRPADLSRAAIESARALHLDAGDPEAAAWAAGVARAAGVAVFLDADTPGPGVLALLRQVDFPIVSREFAESFGEGRPLPAALAERAGRLLVVTLGAGDAFHGAFIWAALEGWGAEAALRAANAAAAMNCRAEGAQGGLPTRAELAVFLKENEPGPWRELEPASGRGQGE
jgi:sugar/nucleoside kinase (ribokinase family)